MYERNKLLSSFGFKHPIYKGYKNLNAMRVGGTTMGTIRDNVKIIEPKTTKNISELESVSTELDMQERVFNEGQKDEFKVNVIVIEKEDYRVPNSVLLQLKEHMKEKPDLLKFKVSKTGEGKNDTKYTVIPLE